MTAAFDPLFVSAYTARGLLDGSGAAVHLPTACPRHATCWEGESGPRVPPEDHKGHAGRLSAPWIGDSYQRGRLTLLLENLRDYGGWDLRAEADKGMRYLGRCACAGFAKGHRVLFRGQGYAGTPVWAQAVSYAATWLSVSGLLPISWSSVRVPGSALAETLDFISMVQHVKCSPLGQRSNPNAAMWSECGQHVLRSELEILRPERIVVLGRDHNAHALAAQVLPAGRVVAERRVSLGARGTAVRLERRTLADRPVDVIVVQHPASPGGTSRALVSAVRELAQEATTMGPVL
jgi:hypothetical protein